MTHVSAIPLAQSIQNSAMVNNHWLYIHPLNVQYMCSIHAPLMNQSLGRCSPGDQTLDELGVYTHTGPISWHRSERRSHRRHIFPVMHWCAVCTEAALWHCGCLASQEVAVLRSYLGLEAPRWCDTAGHLGTLPLLFSLSEMCCNRLTKSNIFSLL